MGKNFIITNERLSFREAKANSPEGYRIPSRLELIKAYQDGVFKDCYGYVWSHTFYDEGSRYIMNMSTGHLAHEFDFKSQKVVYVRKEWGEALWY